MSEVTEMPTVDHVDAVIALGMGIDINGVLSEHGRHIAEEAVAMARSLALGGIAVRNVVGTGGHSWGQEASGVTPPSEGTAMAAHMRQYAAAGHNLPRETLVGSEDKSVSTVENMVNTGGLLNLPPNANLVVVTRKGHAPQARLATQLVFPNAQVGYAFTPDEQSPRDRIYQPLRLMVTRFAMLGVERGKPAAIMQRQRRLEAVVYALAQPLQWVKAHA